jgi:predicted O-methyltransferase YrrM
MRIFSFAAVLVLEFVNLTAKDVINITHEQVCKPPYASDAILRNDPLFIDDFLTLHSLLRMSNPASLFEIGTCTGEGTLIIKNAVGKGDVYSLDLPPGASSYDLQSIGARCYLPYRQIIGDSLLLNYQDYFPIDAWFIDGAHDYPHVFHETLQALLSDPGIIVWHDADIPEVFQAIKDALDTSGYLLYRVTDTRIAFAVPHTNNLQRLIYE